MYLTLMSNVVSKMRSSDSQGSFCTQFVEPLELGDDEFEIGVESAYVPLKFDQFTPNNVYVTVNLRKLIKRELVNINVRETQTDIEKIKTADDKLKQIGYKLLVNKNGSISNIIHFDQTKPKFDKGMFSFETKNGAFIRNDKNQLIFNPVGNHVLQIKFDNYQTEERIIHFNKTNVKTPQEFIAHLNLLISNNTTDLEQLYRKIIFGYEHEAETINYYGFETLSKRYIGTKEVTSLTLSENLSSILGFGEKLTLGLEGCHAATTVNLNAGYSFLMIYTDIVEASYVGGERHNLMALFPVTYQKNSNYVEFKANQIMYKRVLPKTITSIRVTTANEVGEILSYSHNNSRPLAVTLHLRRKRS